jgi:hypothetical protein
MSLRSQGMQKLSTKTDLRKKLRALSAAATNKAITPSRKAASGKAGYFAQRSQGGERRQAQGGQRRRRVVGGPEAPQLVNKQTLRF